MTLNDKLKTSNRIGYYFRLKDVKAFIKELKSLGKTYDFYDGEDDNGEDILIKVLKVPIFEIDKLAGKELIQ